MTPNPLKAKKAISLYFNANLGFEVRTQFKTLVKKYDLLLFSFEGVRGGLINVLVIVFEKSNFILC